MTIFSGKTWKQTKVLQSQTGITSLSHFIASTTRSWPSKCYISLRLKARSHGTILCECDCDFLMWFCETVHTVWLWFISFIWIAHRNHTEWVWNLFMSSVTHTNATAAISVTRYEQYHWHPHNPFLSQSHSEKTHLNTHQNAKLKSLTKCDDAFGLTNFIFNISIWSTILRII